MNIVGFQESRVKGIGRKEGKEKAEEEEEEEEARDVTLQ